MLVINFAKYAQSIHFARLHDKNGTSYLTRRIGETFGCYSNFDRHSCRNRCKNRGEEESKEVNEFVRIKNWLK